MLKISSYGTTYDIIVDVCNYQTNRNLAIQLMCREEGEEWWEPYAMLTVNLDETLEPDKAFVDTNNFPDAEDFIIENHLGTPTGKYGFSGFCAYPEYKFNLEELGKHKE